VSAPLIEKLRAIEDSGEPTPINGFIVHPFAATCILIIASVICDTRRQRLLSESLPAMVRSCVGELADDDVADRYVRMGRAVA
jgi:hypothetical protein